MDSKSSEPIHPELQVSVDLEIVVEGLDSPPRQQKLACTLADVPGIESLTFMGSRIAIRYDPEEVTKARLCELIVGSGFKVSEVECASAAPTIDAHAEDE